MQHVDSSWDDVGGVVVVGSCGTYPTRHVEVYSALVKVVCVIAHARQLLSIGSGVAHLGDITSISLECSS